MAENRVDERLEVVCVFEGEKKVKNRPRFEVKTKEDKREKLETGSSSDIGTEDCITLQLPQEHQDYSFDNSSFLEKEKLEPLYQNCSSHQSCFSSKESNYSKAAENVVDSKVCCKICQKEHHISLDKFFFCSTCKSYYHEACHNDLAPDILEKGDMQWNCFKCQIKKCEDETMQEFSEEQASQSSSSQTDTIEKM
ncbi:hypothetical protein PORY_001495 [Pneumocystis oryctolagi]|uniref:Uncharacterized protein n=1 Tax=Pneumocystis oryctolagi TaxID=42067 RepID=A0ACB7CD67_9ASCO|nr:hypothetical protein PORY_001495 [Pneumocystis oryctolagi]